MPTSSPGMCISRSQIPWFSLELSVRQSWHTYSLCHVSAPLLLDAEVVTSLPPRPKQELISLEKLALKNGGKGHTFPLLMLLTIL